MHQPGRFSVHRFIRTAAACAFIAESLLAPAFSFAETIQIEVEKREAALEINPIMSFRDQVKALNRECAANPDQPACVQRKQQLKEQMAKLRDICRLNKGDERCGAIKDDDKQKGWRIEQFCQENPHSTKCVRKRERTKRRDKNRARFCAKNPDEKRCFPRTLRKKAGAGSLAEWCKSHEDKPKCVALKEKLENLRGGPAKPDQSTF